MPPGGQASEGHPRGHPQTFKVAEVQTQGEGAAMENNITVLVGKDGKAKQGGFSSVAMNCLGSLCPSVLGGRVSQRGQRGRPTAPRAALPLRLPLLQQRHGAAFPGQDATLHQDVPGLSR